MDNTFDWYLLYADCEMDIRGRFDMLGFTLTALKGDQRYSRVYQYELLKQCGLTTNLGYMIDKFKEEAKKQFNKSDLDNHIFGQCFDPD